LYYIFVAESTRVHSTSASQLASSANYAFSAITQSGGHYVVQNRSRSPISVTCDSPYATSY